MIELIQTVVQEASPIELLRSGAISENQYLRLVGGDQWAPLIAQLVDAIKVLLGVAVSVVYARYHTASSLKSRSAGGDERYKEAAIEAMKEAGVLPKTGIDPISAQQTAREGVEGAIVRKDTTNTPTRNL